MFLVDLHIAMINSERIVNICIATCSCITSLLALFSYFAGSQPVQEYSLAELN